MNTATKRFNGIIQELEIRGSESGPLAGLKFAAKDLFDIKGEVTGIGNPTYAQTHKAATTNAKAVDQLLNAGATLVAKSCTDEFAFSFDGINIHFGTPDNPQYPDRIPGGSSSGSASAVAAGLADFSLGTDTGGSIRIPASFCGIFGFRPSHGRVSLDGVAPLAPLLDTVGWFAKNPQVLEKCAAVLLQENPSTVFPKKLFIATDTFDTVSKELRSSLESAVKKIAERFADVEQITLGQFGWGSLVQLYKVFQAPQAWASYGEWIMQNNPCMCPSLKQRWDFTRTVTDAEYQDATKTRNQIVMDLEKLLSGDAVLCLPTTPNLPPLIDASDEELLSNRIQIMNLTALAPLGRTPEVCVPVPLTPTTTTGLSLMAGHSNDMMLLNLLNQCREIWAIK